jgi:hypothetical protein
MNTLKTALRSDTLDSALYVLQRALGIETGDVAGQVFRNRDHATWPQLPDNQRRIVLLNYLSAELDHAEGRHENA